MEHDILDLIPECDVLGLGEATHAEPSFGDARNDLFARLVDRGFRAVAMETDRIAAFAVDDHVRDGVGDIDDVMRDGFSHGFGDHASNRRLVTWMREYNAGRDPSDRLAFHGFDAPTENTSAPSPRRYLDRVLRRLGRDVDLDALIGDDHRWSRTEAVLDASRSVGDTVDAARLRALAEDLRVELIARAPELVAATSPRAWRRDLATIDAARGLLAYHRQCAVPGERTARITGLCALRDVLQSENVLAIREEERPRGAILLFGHNAHVQRNRSAMSFWGGDMTWWSAGSLVASRIGDRYAVVIGSLGRGDALGLAEPAPDTFEGSLQDRQGGWTLVAPWSVRGVRPRDDGRPDLGYSPLDGETIDAADAILHVPTGA